MAPTGASPGQDTSFVDQLLLGPSALGPPERAVSAQRGRRTGAHPPGQLGLRVGSHCTSVPDGPECSQTVQPSTVL